MIKKPTLLVLLLAVGLGAVVYYFDWRHANEEKPAKATSKPAFSVQASDIVSFTLSHPGQSADSAIRFERRNGAWQIVQPVETEAEQSTAQGIVDQLGSARVEQTEPGDADRRKAYGLDPAQVSVDFQLANGSKHTLLLGNTSFSGNSVYTIVDGGQNVALLPQSLSTSAGKSLDDLRDRAVLHMDSAGATSFNLKNSSGELAASKEKDQWKFTKPAASLAGQDSVETLLGAISNAKMVSVASEKPQDLAKYGLVNPAITFTAATGKGTPSTLLVGKKDGGAYFARDPSRPTIFRINEDLYKKLSEKFGDLRDKRLVHMDAVDIQRLEIRDANGAIVLSRKKGNPDEWSFEAPEDQKGKAATAWKILDPVSELKAEEVIDQPAANLRAQLATPAISAVVTDKSGKELKIRISKPAGDFVYAQASDSTSLYKLKKQVFEELNLKPADLVSPPAQPN